MTRWTRRWRHFQAEETGAAVLVTMGAGLVVMLSVAALVIDLGSLRAVRSRAWVATDAASSAAALTLAASHPRGACSVAVGFAEANLPGDPLFLAPTARHSQPPATTRRQSTQRPIRGETGRSQ